MDGQDKIKCILSKPITIDGQEIKEICLDFDRLDTASLSMAEDYAVKRARSKTGNIVKAHIDYLAYLTAEAASLGPDEIRGLSARDFTQVCALTMEYLQGDSQEMPEDVGHIIGLIESFEGLDRMEFIGRIRQMARQFKKELEHQ